MIDAPAPRTSFVGRQTELKHLLDALDADGARLVTLVGIGGTGKTRLAIEAMRRGSSTATAFCDLSLATTEDDVCRAVAAAIGVAIEAGAGRTFDASDVTKLLARALHRRGKVTLVLDNFEQIVDLAPRTVGAWLDAAPDLRLLVTSREPLRLRGEVVVEIPPLSTSSPDSDRSEAATLFADRAKSTRGTTAIDPSLVDEIVRALDGLPLAIELAAARLGVLSPPELREMLAHPLELLTRGPRDLPARHSSLERALEWSWERLTDGERAAFAQSAVFRKRFDRAAAEAVLDVETTHEAGAARILDLLQSLHEKSLLLVDTGGPRPRFRMLGIVRAFAEQHLRRRADSDEVRRRHARHYVQRVRAAASGLSGDESARHAAELADLLDDIAAVVDAAPSGGPSARLALEALLALEPFFDLRGPTFDALRRIGAALDAAEREPPSKERDALVAEVMRLRGKVRRMLGMLQLAEADGTAALAHAKSTSDAPAEARALVERCLMLRAAGRIPELEETARRALALLERMPSPGPLLGIARGMHAVSIHSQGRLEEARPLYEQALAEHRSSGDRRGEGVTLGSFGFLCQDTGEGDAERHYERALRIHRDLGNRRSEGVILGYLGNVHRWRGAFEESVRHYAEAITVLREQDDEQFEGVFNMDWGILLVSHGQPREARARLEEALVHLGRAGDVRCAGLVLGHLGALHASEDRLDDASRCFVEAGLKLRASGDPHFARVVDVLEGQLEVAQALAARRAGRADEAQGFLDRARARLEAAERIERGSNHVVLARERLATALAKLEPPVDALVVGPEGRWFRPPGVVKVDLGPRAPLRRILSALSSARSSRPGEALSTDAIAEAGWPGERIQRAAKLNRVRVALSTLRKMGLNMLLLRTEDGWLLDPDHPFVHLK